MLRGACFVYGYSQDTKLYQVLTDTIKDMLTAQKGVYIPIIYGDFFFREAMLKLRGKKFMIW